MHEGLGLVVIALVMACEGKRAPAPEVRSSPPPAAPAVVPVDAAPVAAAPVCGPGVARTCQGERAIVCGPAGQIQASEACKGGCREGACVNACEVAGVELAYLFTDDRRLLRFDPRKLPADAAFTVVGKLDCPADRSPNAMAIDRQGIAWLNFHGGKLFTASIHTARCTSVNRLPAGAPSTFGMGFTTEGAGSAAGGPEALYVSSMDTPSVLGRIDTSVEPARFTAIGPIRDGRNPEVTGTADGKLFGYVPEPGLGFVQEIDRATGALVGRPWSLGGTGAEEVGAWTMVHWGGVFYVFAEVGDKATLHAIHRKDGHHELVRPDLPFVAVGAGVSTCAPMLEQAAP